MKSRLPEEIELEQKFADLDLLRTTRAEKSKLLSKLEDEISLFEEMYQQTLGKRMAELERLEEEIACLSGGSGTESIFHENIDASQYESFCSADDEPVQKERVERPADQDIKALYREVAKAIHPDLASCPQSRMDRHELMSQANKAYAEEDYVTLRAILRDWKNSADHVEGTDVAAELVRVIRLVARERQEIEGIVTRIAQLEDSYIWRLKLRVDANRANGGDLFADLCAAADLNIAKARRRLSLLKGEKEQQGKKNRSICFPLERSCGTVYTRDRNSLNFSQWQKVGAAKGCVEVGVDQAVRLDVKGHLSEKLALVQQLAPDDLQALFLYEADDSAVGSILHLTGLEELYLSGTRLTDAALSDISPLCNLKRLYLYQTQITDTGLQHLQALSGLRGLTCSGNKVTDQGLALMEQTMPGMKTVSIPWRYK